jgi:hypothetical protein
MAGKPSNDALKKPAKASRTEKDPNLSKHPPQKGRTSLGKQGVKASDKKPKMG